MSLNGTYMSTAEVSDALGITPSSVHRLVREGFLGVKDTKQYKSGLESYFDCSEVNKLLSMMPALRRKWQQAEDSRLGAKKAAFQRADAAEKAVRHTVIKKNFLLSLENYPERAAALLRASFFLYYLNHYAKGGEKYLYDLKEKILKRFQSDFSAEDGLEVFFVEGEQKVLLCTSCRLKAQSMGLDYIKYKTNFGGCPQCRKEEGYYSLFEFRVDNGEHRFYFHTPYNIARKWFENIDELPKKAHEKRKEEALPFGRPISEAEARAVTLKEVITELNSYLGE
jgi:hypothetical protein